MTFRRLIVVLALALGVGLGCGDVAEASGGNYTVVGGTARDAKQIRKALNASSFNWSLVPAQITIHVAAGSESASTPGHIWLSPELLASGSFSWGIVQHEYAHQVDFFLLGEAQRTLLTQQLHASDWCYGTPGLRHEQYGCERFASTLAWAYWPDRRNSQRPTSAKDESSAMTPARFRGLVAGMLGFASPRPSQLAAAARLVRASKGAVVACSGNGPGRARKNPCPWPTPSDASIFNSASFSIPSAMIVASMRSAKEINPAASA
jgi:hypothetical protein